MTLKDEMEDATEKMNEMTQELHSTQIKVTEYEGTYLNSICLCMYIYIHIIFIIAFFINKQTLSHYR